MKYTQILRGSSFSKIILPLKKIKKMTDVEILDYKPEYQNDFRDLNLRWIEKYFKVEATDEEQLNNAKELILDQGGHIYFARLDGQIVGTIGLIKDGEKLYEIVKMAVDPKAQGKQIGKKLLLHAIEKARALGGTKIWLESNTVLEPAIALYRKVGFYEVEKQPTPYARSNIRMELDL